MKASGRRAFYFLALSAYTLAIAAPLLTLGSRQAAALSGGGTIDSPYLITNCDQLENVDDDLTAYYQLFADINCSDSANWNGGAGFQPISSSNLSDGFQGVLDGAGFVITGLSINRPSNDYQGLFALIGSGGTVKDLRLADESVTGRYYLGGLAGATNGATITHVAASGSISGQIDVGGLVGNLYSGSVTKARFTGDVTATTAWAGGLVSDSADSTIDNSYANATVTATGVAGGLIGRLWAQSSEVGVSSSYAAGTVSGSTHTGGLIGNTTGSHSISIGSSFSSADTGGASAIVGQADTVPLLSQDYFDATNNGSTNCVGGSGASGCTAINSGGSDPSYFYQNDTNQPLSSWDFDNTWQEWWDYPTLQGLDPSMSMSTPGVVTNLTVNNTHTSIGLEWDDPVSDGGAPVTSYEVDVMEQGDSDWTYLSNTPYPDLGTGYGNGSVVKFRVAAMNLAGRGSFTETDFYTVGTPPDPVTGLTAVYDGGNIDVNLNWTAPASEGDNPVTDYRIQWRPTGTDDWANTLDTNSTDTVYHDHDNGTTFTLNHRYDFRVAAVSDSGPSDYAEVDGIYFGDQTYNITDCYELQDIKNDLDGHYTLANDIDCSDTYDWNDGAGFQPIGDDLMDEIAFVGTLDGQGHTISDLYIDRPEEDEVGLFGTLAIGSVSNLHLQAEINGGNFTGGVVGLIYIAGTISNVSADVEIGGNTGASEFGLPLAGAGGLVGATIGSTDFGGINISNSYVTGELGGVVGDGGDSDLESVGGLVGFMMDGSSVSNSYSQADIYSAPDGGASIGGAVGAMYELSHGTPTLANVYSSGAIDLQDGNEAGGLVAETSHSLINNSFSASSISVSGTAGYAGLIRNSHTTTVTNSLFDAQLAGTDSCFTHADDPSGCTAVNTDGSPAPDYFLGNWTDPPFDQWDFVGTWHTLDDDYPVLAWQAIGDSHTPDSGGDGDTGGESGGETGAGETGQDKGSSGVSDSSLDQIVTDLNAVVDQDQASSGGPSATDTTADQEIHESSHSPSKGHSALQIAVWTGIGLLILLIILFIIFA